MFGNSVTPKGFFNAIYIVMTGLFDLIVDAIIVISLAIITYSR
jgi:hypothetical protein